MGLLFGARYTHVVGVSWWKRILWPDLFYDPTDPLAGEPLSTHARMTAELEADLAMLDPWDLPPVVAARQLVADTTAMLSMVAVAAGARIDPTPAVLRRPDPGEPYRRTLERIVNGMTRHGRAWLHVDADGSNGYPLAVSVVDDARVNATIDPAGRITGATIDGEPVDRRRLVHIPMRVDRDPLGTSPLEDIRLALEQLSAIYRYSAGYYTHTAQVPPYAVVHPTRLTKPQAELLADQWLTARAERRPAVLSGGITLQTYQAQTAADAMLLDAINYLDATVARVMLIPPSMLNVEAHSSLTYSTTQQQFQSWLAVGLYPMFLSRIEAAFTDLLPRGQTAVFDTSNLTRMDFAGRIDTYATSLAAGIHTLPEVRALEGLPAAPNPAPVPVSPNVEGL